MLKTLKLARKFLSFVGMAFLFKVEYLSMAPFINLTNQFLTLNPGAVREKMDFNY